MQTNGTDGNCRPGCLPALHGCLLLCRLWRGAGIALPVFAARTRNSVGCGEFLDLLPLVEFADASGMRLVQVRCLCQLWRSPRCSRQHHVHGVPLQPLAPAAAVPCARVCAQGQDGLLARPWQARSGLGRQQHVCWGLSWAPTWLASA